VICSRTEETWPAILDADVLLVTLLLSANQTKGCSLIQYRHHLISSHGLNTGETEKEGNYKDRIASIHRPYTSHNLRKTMPQSPGATAPTTRQKANTTTRTQKEMEEAEGQNTDVRSKEQAIAFLTAKQYLIPGNPIDLQTLAYVLLQIGSATTRGQKQITDGIRAVAFLLANASAQKIADEITEMVKSQIQEHIENFTSGVENMRDAVEHVTSATKTMTGKIDEVKDGLQETTEQLTQATQELTEKTMEATYNTPTDPTIALQPRSYAAAIQQEIHADHAEVITRGNTTDKQIMVQKDKDATDNALDSLTEKDLVVKANTALDLMGMSGMDKPRHTTFIGAKKLRNGNVLYQLNTKEAAAWLRAPDVQKAFMEKYGGTSNIRNKLHYVIAEFVPVTFDAGSSFAHAKVEQDNFIGLDSIAYSKYIKPPHLRPANQRVAHVIFGFTDREDANTAITTGIFIEGKHANIRKILTEPKRCLKCQKYGHYVSDCKATEDTCARCGDRHRTAHCTVNETAMYRCTNCTGNEAMGHGAADRECAAFKMQRQKIQERVPENKYKFFPTSSPTTWKLLNEPETHPVNIQPTRQHSNNQQAEPTNWRHQQRFMEDWQTTRRQRGRPAQQDRTQGTHRDTRLGTNERTADNGWPTRPVQRTLDDYMDEAQVRNQQGRERTGNNTTGRTTPWGDRDPNEEEPGTRPNGMTQRRDHTPLEYV